MKDQVDLKLGQDAIKQLAIEDGTGVLVVDQRRQPLCQGVEIERDDRLGFPLIQPRDQAVADFAAGARDQDDSVAEHARSLGIRLQVLDCGLQIVDCRVTA